MVRGRVWVWVWVRVRARVRARARVRGRVWVWVWARVHLPIVRCRLRRRLSLRALESAHLRGGGGMWGEGYGLDGYG